MVDLRDGIYQAASALQMNPVDLATIISYETGGTFNPSQPGPTTQWGQHRGLIQFGEPQARQYGVDWNNPVGSQLGADGAIVRYFQQNGWRPGMGLLDAYSIVNAGGPGRYGASDANNGGAPGTVADKVNEQMGGHRANAERMFSDLVGGSGTNTMTGGAGGDTMATGLLAPQEPAGPPSIWDRLAGVPILGGLANPDRRARLAVGLSGMSLNPNEMLMASNMQGIQQRQQERETTQRMNQTIAYLQSVGRDDLIALVQAGMDPGAALQESARPPETVDPTSMMQNYDFLIAQGYTQEQALAAVQSGTIVNVGGTEQPSTGPISPGFARVPDPTNPSGFRDIPIPGGVEDQTATATAVENAQTVATDTIVTAAQRAREAADSRVLTGPLGAAASFAPFTDNAEIYRQVDVLKAQAAAENLNAMRQQSPTGGALGNVTEGELKLLQDKSGSLNPQSPNFQRDLDDYELTLLKTIHGPDEGQRIFDATRPTPQVSTTTLPPSSQEIQSILDKYAPVQ